MSHSILKKLSIPSAMAMALALPADGEAAVDMFMKITGVEGESEDPAHKGEIDVLAWSWGMSQSTPTDRAPRRNSSGACFGDMNITKYIDTSSEDLHRALSDGGHFTKATLTVRKAGEKPLEYIIIDMAEVFVTSVSTGASGGEDRLTEIVTLNFAEVESTYVPQSSDGSEGPPKIWTVPAGKCY